VSSPLPAAGSEDAASRSGILKAEFGRNWRWWAWFRAQWSAMSITVVVAGVAALGGWALNLKTRVVVLETQVVPVLKDEGRVDRLEATQNAQGDRITRLEGEWDNATKQADTPPAARKRRGPGDR
jgi:hypothetical protein